MRVKFLVHSGFWVELPSVTLLFDWYDGELPALRPGVPLAVFASHSHEDHFQPHIFDLDGESVRFVLGRDLRLTDRNRSRWKLSDAAVERCIVMKGGQTVELWPGVVVEALSSTDEGAAFLVTADGQSVFHAGDLNWWHWKGEDPAWNRNMEANFRRCTEPLRDRWIDLAMLVLDPRQEDAAFLGPKYFLETAKIQHFLPMHQWEDFRFTQRFLDQYPEFTDLTVPIFHRGETFQF